MNSSHLRRKVGSVTQWNAGIHEIVFRDLLTTIPNKAHRVRALWALFVDECRAHKDLDDV